MPSRIKAELRRDHNLIERLAKRLDTLIGEDATPEQLSAALDHLVETVRDHLEHEDAMIYTLAMQARPGFAQDVIDRAHAEFEQLKTNWSAYLTSWSPSAIAGDRQGFVNASRAMLPRLRDRVRLEDELLLASALIRPSTG
jgi:hypothetical protein